MANPRQAQVEAAVAGFYDRVSRGKVPKQRRYNRVVGRRPGTYRHARSRREQQRLNARTGQGAQAPLWRPDEPQG